MIAHEDLDRRLDNWGACYRWRIYRQQACSYEGNYRSPQRRHWEPPAVTPPQIDGRDAEAMERAITSIRSLFHVLLLKHWYVMRWAESRCLIEACKGANVARRAARDFDPSLGMAKALVADALDQPAVYRAPRVQRIVEAEMWKHYLLTNAEKCA